MTDFLEIISLPFQSKNNVSFLWQGTINKYVADCTLWPATALPGGSSLVPMASMYMHLNGEQTPLTLPGFAVHEQPNT